MQSIFKRAYRKLARQYPKLRQILFTGMEKWVKRASSLGDHTFFDPNLFSWVEKIEAEWPKIRAELDKVMQEETIPAAHEVSLQQKGLTDDQHWRTFFFALYGTTMEVNCRKCPDTMRALAMIPGMKTAFFSILSPHKHIAPHRGPYNGVLRYHLGLRVPANREKCRIRVGQDIGRWAEGKSLVFDDTFEHEVWNDTDEIRVILFVDFVRPLPLLASICNKLHIRFYARTELIQDALQNLHKIHKH